MYLSEDERNRKRFEQIGNVGDAKHALDGSSDKRRVISNLSIPELDPRG